MEEGRRVRAGDVPSPVRRRSNRLSATETEKSTVPFVKHSIVLRKIRPQKNPTVCASAAPRRSPQGSAEATKENTCGSAWLHSAEGQGSAQPHLAATPSDADLLPCTLQPGDQDSMSRKPRRSYSRLSPFGSRVGNLGDGSDTSTPNQWHPGRHSLFGFERLLATEALPAISPVRRGSPRDQPPASHVLLDAIPGVPAPMEKRKKKRKVPQIENCVLDEWAAQMNASFEEAERFNLVVE